MDATTDIANQQVFHVAKLVDPLCTRTVGVLTKCDAVQFGDEDRVIELASNEKEQLHHGWFLVRNRSKGEVKSGVSLAKGKRREKKFFRTKPWNSMSYKHLGVESLRTFLYSLTYTTMQADYLGLLEEVRELVAEGEEPAEPEAVYRPSFLSQFPSFSKPANPYDEKRVSYYQQGIVDDSIDEEEYAEDMEEEELLEFDLEAGKKKRPVNLWNAIISAFTLALVLFLMGLGFRSITTEIKMDGNYARLAFVAVVPCQIFISLVSPLLLASILRFRC